MTTGAFSGGVTSFGTLIFGVASDKAVSISSIFSAAEFRLLFFTSFSMSFAAFATSGLTLVSLIFSKSDFRRAADPPAISLAL